MKKSFTILAVLLGHFALGQQAYQKAEILWDSWGIPHIYAKNEASLFYAYGWAQARNHGNLLLQLYGQARGKAAAYWGEKFIESDRWVLVNDIENRAAVWFDAHRPDFQINLTAFAQGINDYVSANPDLIDPSFHQVLPITGTDVVAHCHRITHFMFLASPGRANAALREAGDQPGSNAWAIGPKKSTSGYAMLLTNPHLPWSDYFTYFEAHLNAPGVNTYGISRIGFPVLTMAFNPSAGYAQTVNTHDGQDIYQLALQEEGYRWDDGKTLAFTVQEKVCLVKLENERYDTLRWVIKSSVHGPVISTKGDKAYALRVVGLSAHGQLEQYWDMCRAKNFQEFEKAISPLQIPMYTLMFADSKGNIFNLFNGRVPKRPYGNWIDWSGVVKGDTSATLWHEYHPYEDLPKVLNPASGWLQNTNEPPWTATWPMVNNPGQFPPYLAPDVKISFRTQGSIRMLMEKGKISFEQLMDYKHETRMELADHLLDDLIALAQSDTSELLASAATVLTNWDRRTDVSSQGAILFDAFVREWTSSFGGLANLTVHSPVFKTPWDSNNPLNSPRGFADDTLALSALKQAAEKTKTNHGSLDVAWGNVFRFRVAGSDLPGNGGPGPMGVFRTMTPVPDKDGKWIPAHGDTYFSVVEFGKTLRVMALTAYGNASQPGSPYATKQLPLLSAKTMRPVYLEKKKLLKEIVEKTSFLN
jgi:acyl-homoserine-lactone acylase